MLNVLTNKYIGRVLNETMVSLAPCQSFMFGCHLVPSLSSDALSRFRFSYYFLLDFYNTTFEIQYE